MLVKIASLLETYIGIQRLKFDEDLERSFLDFYSQNFIRHRRSILLLSLIIICLITPYDIWIFGETWKTQTLVKYGLGFPCAAVLGYLVFSHHFEKNQQLIVSICCLFYSITLSSMLAIGPDQAIALYQPSYIMLCFFAGSIVRLLISRVLFVLIATQVIFNILIIWVKPQSMELIASYNIFYSGCTLMAVACSYYMEQSVRKEFLRVHNLQSDNEELHQLACTDPLTTLYNRRHMEESFEKEWLRCTRHQVKLSLLMLDIDHFKLYNDNYGHQKGDECLRIVAQCIQNTFKRSADIVARYGGEEFAVLLPETSLKDAENLAQTLLQNISNLQLEHEYSSTSDKITISIGISCTTPQRNEHYGDLIKQADQALYHAKEQGRNRSVTYSPISS